MTPRLTTSIIPLPHYFLALLLAKSKPATKSRKGKPTSEPQNLVSITYTLVTEWLQLLASFIKDGPRLNDGVSKMQYIDEAAMWHNAYTQSEEAQLILRARNLELERLLEEFTGETDPLALTSPKRRRRRVTEPFKASASRIQKKPRLVASAKAASSHPTVSGIEIEIDERPATASLG